jgi:hypothetical protein
MPPHHEPHHHAPQVTVTGTIGDVFAHRFVLRTAQGNILADVGPKGADLVELAAGAEVELVGEQKPSELKVLTFRSRGRTVDIPHGPKHGPHHATADPAKAFAAVRAAGFTVVGEAKRKPKHFEIIGRKGKDAREFHVEFDGEIRKTKPVHLAG